MAVVGVDNKYGFINKMGKPITPLIYENARFFEDGMAKVLKDGEMKYVDINGKELLY